MRLTTRSTSRILLDLVNAKTVSAWKDNNEMRKGAKPVASLLKDLGFKTSIRSYGGHPIVLGGLGEGPKEYTHI